MTDEWQATIDARATAIFLDVDGTLLGFKDRPEDVVADAGLRDLLETLRHRAGGALALVSGRRLADLDRIMTPLMLAAGGTHGAELRWPDGRLETVGAEDLAALRAPIEAFVAGHDGLALEDKGAALAVHFRRAPAQEEAVARFLDGIVEGHALMVQRGKMVAEVKSSVSSKGKAIERFMTEPPFAGRTPLFIGDDLTDEHGFASVEAQGGLSIKVGAPNEQTIARYRLADVPAVVEFLKQASSRSRAGH